MKKSASSFIACRRYPVLISLFAILSMVPVLALASEKQTFQQMSIHSQKHDAIPLSRLGTEIDTRYNAQFTGPVAMQNSYRLSSKMQSLEADVAEHGLTITSLAKSEGLGSFSIAPVAVKQG